ncbi:CpXC domain-containing protein [Dubosiella newyorkensis]|uniref:CpXC domain-containing protein n=1 Tax=Dubosiella newyorkensis TaxID=1862672 RepID=UPI0023F00998|nr:CpXC domain-containing protein [Dubosiella newyorkensis]
MKARMFEIECPSCHETFFLMRDTYYVKGMDPIAEERLLNGSYFMHRCRKCDTIFTIYHPLLFRSPKKFNLIMSKKKQIETLDENEKQFVINDPKDFIRLFRILVYEADLNVVDRLEKYLSNHGERLVEFESFDQEQGLFWFYVDHRLMAVRTKE